MINALVCILCALGLFCFLVGAGMIIYIVVARVCPHEPEIYTDDETSVMDVLRSVSAWDSVIDKAVTRSVADGFDKEVSGRDIFVEEGTKIYAEKDGVCAYNNPDEAK